MGFATFMTVGNFFLLLLVVAASSQSSKRLVPPNPRPIVDDDIIVISRMIWAADYNRLDDMDLEYLNKPGRILQSNGESLLFTSSDGVRDILESKPTYRTMMDLFDKSDRFIGYRDAKNDLHNEKEYKFLDEILETEPMEILYNWLRDRGLASPSKAAFKKELHQYWFTRYKRSAHDRGQDSSGFEHTFAGELHVANSGLTVVGVHNWVRIYLEENAKHLVYYSRIRSCPPAIETFSFTWLGSNLKSSTVFMRTSPEVEIALYTLCALTRPATDENEAQKCEVQLNNDFVDIMVRIKGTGSKETIEAAHPIC